MNPKKEELVEFTDKPTVYKVRRSIYFFDEVNNKTVCDACRFIDELESESQEDIEFVINSVGGSIYDGMALYDRIRSTACKVNTVGTGFVASMGLIIFLAGDNRTITENVVLLNHQGSSEVAGKTSDIKIEAAEMTRIEELTVEIIAERTGLSPKIIKKDIKLGDNYISPEVAVAKGFAHGVISNKRDAIKKVKK